MPAENVVTAPPAAQLDRTRSSTVCAPFAPEFGSTSANSSPPYRATQSTWRVAALQAARQRAQRPVTDLVTEAVVHRLEVVEVDDHHRVAGLQRLERACERPPVRELGERIGLGVVRERGRLLQALEHVTGFGREELGGLPCVVRQPLQPGTPHRDDDSERLVVVTREREQRSRTQPAGRTGRVEQRRRRRVGNERRRRRTQRLRIRLWRR